MSAGADECDEIPRVMSEDEVLLRLLALEDEAQVVALWKIFELGELSAEVARTLVTQVWQQPNFPLPVLGADNWATLFQFAGYTVDGEAAERPDASLILFRGSPAEHREGFAWTEDLQMAEKFARPRFEGHSQSVVWIVEVPPCRLLARITAEREYVLDARGLKISPAPRSNPPPSSASD